MHKKTIKKKHLSFFAAFFHKPLFILFIIATLPFLVWGAQQTQLFISLGKNFKEVNSTVYLQSETSACPQTSNQSYSTLSVISDFPKPNIPPEQNPEINMLLRGYEEINEKLQLIDYGGDTDPLMPPSLGTMFTNIPSIAKTYKVRKWDYANYTRSPQLESNWPVNLIGLSTSPGEPLMGPKAGREIGGGNVLMLIYASPNTATFVHGRGENPQDGYFIHLDNFCVDPHLLATYQNANALGRGSLPVIRTGQVFGYGNGSDVRIAIRDSGDWMDPRARKDWWQGSDALSSSLPPPTANPTVSIPATISNTPTLQSQLTIFPTTIPTIPNRVISPSIPVTTKLQPTAYNLQPTQYQPPSVFIPSPKILPTATPTSTPAPFIDIGKTAENARSFWDTIINRLTRLSQIILP